MNKCNINTTVLRILSVSNYKISLIDTNTKALATDKRYKIVFHSVSLSGSGEIDTAILSYMGKKLYFHNEYSDGYHKKVIESY